jgi:hypothetical protein
MEDNITALYNELKGKYEINSEDDFRSYLSDANNREALRKELEAEYDVGDSASFSNYLGFNQEQSQQQPSSTDTTSAETPAIDQQKPETVVGSQQWRENIVNVPGDHSYNGKSYGEVYDQIIQEYGKNLTKQQGDPYAEARAQIMQAGITDDLRPEDADKLALDIRHGYANRYAGNASKEMVSALPDQVPNIDDLMDGLWYTRDMQQRVNHEASRLGLRKENYVNYYMKPQLAKALSDRYGYDVQSAKLIAGRLLSQDEHTNEVIRQNEAMNVVSQYAAPIIEGEFKKIQEAADKEAAPTMLNLNGTPEQKFLASVKNWQATDPETVWQNLKPMFDNMGSWMSIVGNEQLFDQVSQMAEAEGIPVNAYIDKYVIPSYANAVQKEFERIAVEREMPKDTYEYIVKKMGESLIGNIGKWMLASEARRRAQGEAMQLTDTGQGEYKPGFGAKVAGGAAAMLPDMVMPFGGPFGLTAKVATMPLRGVAQELITSGTRPLLARITQASLSGSASLGAFEGLKGAIEGGINPTGYEHLLAEDKRNVFEILGDMVKGGFERGIPSAVTGATMIGGPIGQKISNGRGLLANLAGWGTQVGVDAGLATAINIPKVVSGAITADDLKDEFFENIGTFAALGLHSKGKEFANLASGGRSINGVEFTKPEIESIEDRYLMPLRDVINKIDEAQSKRSLITKSRLGIDEAQEKRDAITEVGTEIFNDMLYSYGVPADLKVKVCTAFNLPVPENALKPKVLETTDKVVSDAVSEGFDDKVNQDYNKPGGVLDKLKKGESLSDYELTLRLLIQDNKRYNEIGEKLQAGNQLTEDEMAFVNQYNSRIDSIQAKMFSQELDRMASDFEKRNDLKKGTIKRMFADLKAGKGVEDAYMLDKFESELDEYSRVLDEIKAARQQQESAPTEDTQAPVDEAPKINKTPDTEVPVTDEASGIKEFPTEEIPEDVTEKVAPQMDRSELADKLTNDKTGTIMEVMLADGRKAYVIDGVLSNEYGRVTLADENGDVITMTDGNGYTIDRLPVNLLARDEAGNIIMNEQTVGEFLGTPENAATQAPAVKDNLTTDQSAMSRIPVTDGVHQFEQAKPEDTLAALRESLDTPEELAETIDEQISDLTNELQQLTKAPKGKNKKVLTMDEKLQKKSAIKELQQRIDYWNSVKEVLNKPAEEQKPAEVEQPAAEIEQKEPVIEQETPVTEQAPTAEETAQMKIAQGNIKSNLGKNYEFQNQDGTRSVVTLKSFKGDDGVEVMRQDFDAEGNPKGSPYSQELKTLDVSGSIINGFMKPVLTPEEQLREQYKGRKSIQDVLDVVTDEEMLKIIQASRSGDSDAFNSLIDEYRNDHVEDLILKDRDERNAKVAEIMDGPGTRESKLRRIRKIYQEGNFEDAVIALEDDTLAPVSVDEIVADLHSRQPKKGEGPIAYFSYTAPDGHEVIGMQDESGHGKKTSGDTNGYAPWLAPQGKGMSLTQYAENLRSQMTEAQQEQYDVQDVRNAVINLFGSAEKPSDITTMSIKNGVLQAEQAARRLEDHWIDNVNYQKVSHDEKSFAGRLAKAKQTTNTEPTEAQKEKGNYKKGHVSFGGYDYVIENPEGSMRRGEADGKKWEQKMNNTYGYILGKYGKDGDHLDMFINDGQDLDSWNGKVYVVDQVDPKTGLFDEHKVMYGFNSEAEARDAYLSNYEKGWKGLGAITGVSKEAFDKWLDSSKRKLIRFADHSITKEALEKQAKEPATDADIELAFRDKIMDIEKHSGVPLTTDMEEAMPILNRENGRDEQSAEETEDANGNRIRQQKAEAPIFVSNALKAVEAIKQEKATPDQWLAMIQKNGGLKAGEDKWIGLSDWLTEQKKAGKSVTKQEVMDYIRQNQIQVEETHYQNFNSSDNPKLKEFNDEYQQNFTKAMKEMRVVAKEYDAFDDEMLEKYGEGWVNKLEGEDKERNEALEERYAAYKNPEEAAFKMMVDEYGDDFEQAFEVFNHELIPITDYYDEPNAAAKYFLGKEDEINSTRLSYTTDGLENKREIALTVPTIEPYNESDEIHFGDAGGGRAVAWARFGETTDADGNKVLVIDEIQSKRHQDAREKGYKGEVRERIKKLREKIDRFDIDHPEFNEMLNKWNRNEISKEEMEAWREKPENKAIVNNHMALWDEYDKLTREFGFIPDAPFEKNWHELAMKRMLRYAAENGYDKVAWTTGAQQAERYDIGRVIASIERTSTFQDGVVRYDLFDHLNNDISLMVKDGVVVDSSQEELKGKPLGDVVGKEVAVKMASMKDDDNISAHDLHVGGEGMKGFYDEILPRFMNKYGKKWGVKVGEINLPNLEESAQKMWSIDVTPEMKESVMEGQPMFFKTNDGYAYGFTYRGKIYIDPSIATSETPIHEYGHLWAEMKRQSAPEEWNHIKQTLLADKLVEPFVEKVKRDYPELTGDGKEDDFVEEVLTQFSGKHGAEKLRKMAQEIKKELGDDAAAETIAEVAIRRVKSVLNDFWKSVCGMMGWKYTNAEEIADAVLRDLLNGVNPAEKIKEMPKDLKSQGEVERTLMGMHNISEDKLKKAIKLGGLANPSMAVVDTNNGVLDNFGEISLIPKSDLIDKKKGRNVGTWASDAYTPRFPKTYIRISDKNRKALDKWLDSLGLNEEMRYQLGQQFNDYYNSFSIKDNALQYAFLKEKGLTDKVDYVRHDDVSPVFLDLVDKYGDNIEEMIMRTRDDEAFRKEVSEGILSHEISNAMKDIRRNEGETAREYMDRRKKEASDIRKLLTDENDTATFDLTDHFLRDNARKMHENGKFDGQETLYRTRRYISDNGLSEEYAKYFADKAEEFGIEEMVANGHDRNGHLKFKPITLEDISKQMKKEGRAGGEGGFGDSPGALRAKLTPMLNSLEEMRKEKGRLVSHEDFEAEKDPYFEKVFHIQHDLFNGDYDDMLKVLRTSDMEAAAKRLGYDLTPEEVDDLKVFKNLTMNLPTEYFETKFERPVMLNEFEIAVVPENTDPEVVKALKDAGVDVRTYSSPADNPDGGRENRRNAIMDAVIGRDDIRFQMVGEKGAAEADKAEGVKTRQESLKVAEELEKADKSSKAIKFATGWERGKDGKWRYETVDEKADILDDYNQKIVDYNNKRAEFHKEQGRLLELYDRLGAKIPKRLDSKKYSEEEQAKFREMRKEREKVWKQYMASNDQEKELVNNARDGHTTKLVDLLGENHELFKYYPQLKDITVRYGKNMQQGVAGSYNDKDGIKINIDQMHVFGDNNDLNNDNLNGILVHEIQHAIQDIEGFAKGGNLYTATTEAGINAIVQKKQAEQAAIANKIDMFNKWLNNPEELKLISQLDRRTVEEEKKHLEEQLDDLSYQHDRIGMYIDKIKHDKAPAMSDARDLYSRLAGEVEARNASERINMSEEDRRNTPIEKTEDYARDNQVVMMDYPENGEKDSISFKDIKPIGKGVFGDIYDQFKGKAKEAFKFLLNKKGGDVLSVFHRNDVGDIDLVWGDAAKEMGLDHIISKHVGPGKDFETVDDAFSKIESVINNGKLIQNGKQRYVVSEDGYRVGIRKDFNGIKKNWVVTAVDYNRSKEEKGITTNPTSASHGAEESELAALRNSSGKDKKNIDSLQEKNEKSADEMPKFSKVSSPEPELTPEERQYWNKWDADMKKWKEQNALPANAEAPGPETPKQPDETMMDYVLRITKERKQRALWLTAPKLEDYQRMRTDKDTLESAREEEQKYPDSPSAKMRRIAAEFQQIRSAMSRQKAYDKSTVKAVTDFAQNYMRMGFGDNLSRGDVERMLSSVKNAVGAKTVKKEIDNIMNILTDNYLRNLEQQVVKLSSIRELRKNVQGVEVQGKLELKGQRMIQAFRTAMEYRMSADEIREKLGEVAEKMGRNDEEAPMWEQEFEGLSIALQYQENIESSRKEWAELDRQYKEAVKEYKDSNRSYQAQQELLASIENAMMENKIERIGMYGDIIGRLQGNISESMKGAHEFIEREKERIKHIQQIANFDLAGKDMGAIRKPEKLSRIANSTVARFFLGPLATFEQMLKQFGSRSVNGEGYLYNHFMRKWMDATDNAFVNETKAKEELDEKAREVFGDEVKRWSDLYKLSNQPGMEVKVNDQGEDKTLTLTQGNMLYIYMANKMNDGKMKLRKMGITEEDVEAIKEALDPRLVQLGDWIQEDYLPKRRVEYNKVYERMFGAPMATIENYFPIKVLGDARYQEKDVNTMDQDPALPSTITGNIIKRTKNALPLDILNTDAVSLALEHIEDMERWAAQAELNKDINTLLSYTTFRNKVKNMNTIYGSGDQLWNNFADTARMAAGTYRPKAKPGSVDKTISNIAKGVTAAKISFRMYTAFKQILSAPAFAHDVDLGNFIKNSVNPYGSWKWAMENMPVFQKRWKSRQVGDTRLMDDPTDWKMWKNNIVQMAARMGMSPNALVDGITCAVGARSIYESRLKKYTEMGLSEAEAEKRALQDAEIGYNLTQQSSEGAFVSAIQKDRTVAANMLSVFRNSSMAYTRQWVDAARNLSHMAQKGFKDDSIEFMTRQFQDQLGLDQEQAEEAAEKEYARAQRHELAKLLNMMFGVTVAWNLGAYLPYLLLGDDDDTKKEMMKDALLKGFAAGPTEGLAAGNIISELTGRALGEKTRKVFNEEGLGAAIDEAIKQSADYEINPLPLFADIQGMIKKGKYDKLAAAQDLFNIIAQSSVGVNPQTFTDIWNAAMDYGAPAWDGTSYSGPDADNLSRPKEFALFIMRLMNAPTSSWRNKYIDELDMSADDAKKLSYEEMARRYAHYKHWKDAPVMGWFRGDEERQEKMKSIRKQFKQAVAERMGRTVSDMNDEAVENLSDKMDSKDMIDILQKEITRRVQKSIENMDDYQLEQEFDSSQRPFKRKLIAKNLSKRTGASSDPYGDKPSSDYEQLYQELRTGADVTEDAELLNMQENARDRGDEKRKDEISKKRSKLRNKYIKGEKGAYGLKPGDDKHNKAVMEQYRKARRELYDSLRR